MFLLCLLPLALYKLYDFNRTAKKTDSDIFFSGLKKSMCYIPFHIRPRQYADAMSCSSRLRYDKFSGISDQTHVFTLYDSIRTVELFLRCSQNHIMYKESL